MNLHRAYVYILSNKNRTVLYVGVTNDLERRMQEHIDGHSAFTKKYNVHELLFYEIHTDINLAIRREKLIKRWKKEWKLELIRSMNNEMINLAKDWNVNGTINHQQTYPEPDARTVKEPANIYEIPWQARDDKSKGNMQ